VDSSLQLFWGKGFGKIPGMLTNRMTLGWSLPLQKSDLTVVKLPWGGGDEKKLNEILLSFSYLPTYQEAGMMGLTGQPC
jgi:hypothetical protein